MKNVNVNFLEPSGPLQACNGTALPLPFIIQYMEYKLYYSYKQNFKVISENIT